MTLQFIRHFIDATEMVLKQVLGTVPDRGRVVIYDGSEVPVSHVNVIIGVTGQVSGQVAYGMGLETAQAIAAAMMGEPQTELTPIGESAIGELANMIAGNAVTLLSREGLKTDITHPSLLKGDNVQMNIQKTQNVLTPFNLPQGQLSMLVGLQKPAPEGAKIQAT